MKKNKNFNFASHITLSVSGKLQRSFHSFFCTVCAMICCMRMDAETLTVIYDPIEGGRPPRIDIVCSSQYEVSIEDKYNEELIIPFLMLKSNLLNISLPLNYPAWYLTSGDKIIAHGDYPAYTIEDSGTPEKVLSISINDGVFNLTGFDEETEVDVYDIDDKCSYLTIDCTLSIPIEEINSKRYKYLIANDLELYFNQDK